MSKGFWYTCDICGKQIQTRVTLDQLSPLVDQEVAAADGWLVFHRLEDLGYVMSHERMDFCGKECAKTWLMSHYLNDCTDTKP